MHSRNVCVFFSLSVYYDVVVVVVAVVMATACDAAVVPVPMAAMFIGFVISILLASIVEICTLIFTAYVNVCTNTCIAFLVRPLFLSRFFQFSPLYSRLSLSSPCYREYHTASIM